jgi:hypothetical protein
MSDAVNKVGPGPLTVSDVGLSRARHLSPLREVNHPSRLESSTSEPSERGHERGHTCSWEFVSPAWNRFCPGCFFTMKRNA